MTPTRRTNRRLTRRALLTHALATCAGVVGTVGMSACRQKVVEVERIIQVEKEVTKIVTEIVKETVVVERTRVETRVVQVEAPTPTPFPAAPQITIQGIDTPWTHHLVSTQDAFSELFDLDVRWRPLVNWADYDKRIAADRASGNLADLIEAPSGALPARWRRDGLCVPLDDMLDAGLMDTDGMFPSALAAFERNGELLGMPFIIHGGRHLLGYDAGLIESLGIDPPRPDWPITRLATLWTGDGAGVIGFGTAASLPDVYPLLELFGVRLYDDSGALAVDPRQLRILISWLRRMAVPTTGAPHTLLTSGALLATTVTMNEVRRWAWRANGDADPDFGACLFPLMPGQTEHAVSVHAMGYCATRPGSETSSQWLRYVTSSEMGVTLFGLGLAAPGCRTASWTEPRVTDEMPLCAQLADVLQHAPTHSLPASLDIEGTITTWNDALRKTLDGRWTVEQCVDGLLDELTRIAESAPSVGTGPQAR